MLMSDATVLAGIYELVRIAIMLDELLSDLYRKCTFLMSQLHFLCGVETYIRNFLSDVNVMNKFLIS